MEVHLHMVLFCNIIISCLSGPCFIVYIVLYCFCSPVASPLPRLEALREIKKCMLAFFSLATVGLFFFFPLEIVRLDYWDESNRVQHKIPQNHAVQTQGTAGEKRPSSFRGVGRAGSCVPARCLSVSLGLAAGEGGGVP